METLLSAVGLVLGAVGAYVVASAVPPVGLDEGYLALGETQELERLRRRYRRGWYVIIIGIVLQLTALLWPMVCP